MNDQPLQIGDQKTHLRITYQFFGDEELHCPFCGTQLYHQIPHASQLPERRSCPHVLYYWEKTHFGGHFFFVRPDFGKAYIQALLKSDYYQEFLENPHRNNPKSHTRPLHHPRPLKKNDIALFASGAFSSEDPLFSEPKWRSDDPLFLEKIRYEEIGAKVGNISSQCPSILHPECLANDVVVHYNYEGVGNQEKHDGRTRFIAISPTEYLAPGLQGL